MLFFDLIPKPYKSKGLSVCVRWDSVTLGMLALRNCEPCTALDFKGAGNKMTVDDGIFWEKYWISVKSLIFCKSVLSL